ncbi:MAG: phosphotransferase [bacterium]|jgi:Ser/Thr protein kinase RdoA (MazF antagonist)
MKQFSELTKRGKILRYRSVALQALESYPVRVRSMRFISSGSKPVFRVDTDSGRYAVKFHNPLEHKLPQMMGELRFLSHVARVSGLDVETPLRNRSGKLVTVVRSPLLPEPAYVAVCRWVSGRALADFISVGAYRNLGRCAAMLHRAARSFRPGKNFDILVNDRVFYWDKETILSLDDKKLLPKRRQDLFRKGARLVDREIKRTWKNRKPVVIHNDLHPCNIKVHRGALSIFDFEDITWGFPEQDIGTAIYHVRFEKNYPGLLGGFRAGYEGVLPWPFGSGRQLELLAAARVLMFANYVINYNINPAKYLRIFERKLRTILEAP